MHKRMLLTVLAVLLINSVCFGQTGAGTKAQADKEADKVYSTVFRLGVDGTRRVKVALHDGTKLIGYIREINDNDFVVVADETRTVNRLTYRQVKNVKPYESKGRKVGSALGYGLFFGMIVAMFIGYMGKE